MALTVRTTAAPRITTTVRKTTLSGTKLEEIGDIDTDELQDGYTLVYDAATDKWVAQAVAGVTNIDGGTF